MYSSPHTRIEYVFFVCCSNDEDPVLRQFCVLRRFNFFSGQNDWDPIFNFASGGLWLCDATEVGGRGLVGLGWDRDGIVGTVDGRVAQWWGAGDPQSNLKRFCFPN